MPVQPIPAAAHDTLLGVLARRKALVLAALLATLLLALIYYAVWPRTFAAIGIVRVEPGTPVALGDQNQFDAQSALLFRHAEARLLTTDEVLVKALKFAEPPIQASPWFSKDKTRVQQLKKELDVTVDRDSGLISVELRGENKTEITNIVNGIMQAYKTFRVEQESGNTTDVIALLEAQRETKEAERQATRVRILQLKNSSGSVPMGDGGNLVLIELQALSEQLVNAKRETMDAKRNFDRALAAYEQTDPQARMDSEDGSSVSLSGESEELIRQRIVGLEQRLQTLRQTYLPSHPQIRRVAADVAKLRATQVAVARGNWEAARGLEEELLQEVEGLREQGEQQTGNLYEIAMFEGDLVRLEDQIDELDQSIVAAALQQNTKEMQITLSSASTDNDSVSPKLATTMAGAGALGLIGGILLALVVESNAPRLPAGEKSVSETMALPVIGTLPAMDGANRRRLALAPIEEPGLGFAAEAVEVADAMAAGEFAGASTILVTSPTQRQGRTVAAGALAVSMAALGKRVLIVDADLEKPDVHELFDKPNEHGLADVLRGNGNVSDFTRASGVDGLTMLAAGDLRADDAEDLLGGQRLDEALRQMREQFDVVLIDAAAESMGDAARIVASGTDATLLVMRGGTSDRRRAEQARDRLLDMGANVNGMLLVNMPTTGRMSAYSGDVPKMAASA
ncbi:MAG: AAA family ATPase [Planctomycetota bacterium]